MSFSFPKINFQAIQESIGKVDLDAISKSIQNSNPGKAVSEYSEHLMESIQPLTAKTQTLISTQVAQIQQLATAHAESGVEISELPEDYVLLEKNCDILLKLYTDLIHYTDETYATPSYDFPPGNSAFSKLKETNVSLMFTNKLNQLKNVATPQDMEKVLLGQQVDTPAESDSAQIQVTPAVLPKTLYGRLAHITSEHSRELSESGSALGFALLQVSSAYVEIASARLDQDKAIMTGFNSQLVAVLNDQFIKVNELRKKVYAARSEFDVYRASAQEEEEDEKLIEKEDEFVSAIEVAVVEMRKLLTPSTNVNLLKVFAQAQKDFFDMASARLGGLITELGKVELKEDE
ncbi:hypothetical protein PUMCH_001838 [Australozyma saopauloensis]|uniref:BAR domain-containing protein n=1 Tax=Australozyma saopauloensis TaxID=291208 RepID=A0AAX4H7U1_9ASCO|nr:hypothetical protein PUMCH_001838 [[Candida] saopauloensis]